MRKILLALGLLLGASAYPQASIFVGSAVQIQKPTLMIPENGSGGQTFSLGVPALASSYTVTLPNAVCASGEFWSFIDGSGTLACAASLSSALTDSYILIGNVSNVAAAQPVTGDVLLSNGGVTSIATGVIVDADINASAAITRSKIASGSNNHVVINSGAGALSSEATLAASRGGLATDASAFTGVVKASSGTFSAASILNADIDASAAIDATKIADGSVSSTEFQYINTLSSNAQTQLNALNVLTTKGDTMTYSTVPARLAVGSNGATYTADSGATTGNAWKFAGSDVVVITDGDSPYTVTTLTKTLLVNAGAGAVTVNLPAAPSFAGYVLNIIKTDTSTSTRVTVTPNGADNICGQSTISLYGARDSVQLVSDGTNWQGYNQSCWRQATAELNCQSSSAITENEEAMVSAIGNVSAGACAITLRTGYFSSTPDCSAMLLGTLSATPAALIMTLTSATSISVDSVIAGAAGTNYNMTIFCRARR